MAQKNSTLTLSKCQTATNVSPLERESSPKNDISKSVLERLPPHLASSNVVKVVLRREHFGSWETPREQWVQGFQLIAVVISGRTHTERYIKNFMPSQCSVAEIKHECEEIAKALKVTLIDATTM